MLIHRHYGGPCGVDRQRFDASPRYSSGMKCPLKGDLQRAAVILMSLGGKIGIIATPQNRILFATRSKPAADAVEDRDSDARRPEIYSGYDGHCREVRRRLVKIAHHPDTHAKLLTQSDHFFVNIAI